MKTIPITLRGLHKNSYRGGQALKQLTLYRGGKVSNSAKHSTTRNTDILTKREKRAIGSSRLPFFNLLF